MVDQSRSRIGCDGSVDDHDRGLDAKIMDDHVCGFGDGSVVDHDRVRRIVDDHICGLGDGSVVDSVQWIGG